MKIIKDAVVRGKRQVTVTLDEGEVLAAFYEDSMYELAEPLNGEIVQGHMIARATPTTWCVISQKWIT